MSILDSEPHAAEIGGRYFDGRSTRPSTVRVSSDGVWLHVAGEHEGRWILSAVSISERLGRAQRRILLPDSAFIEVPDAPQWDALPQQWGRSGVHLAWLESRWRYVLASLVGIVVACAVLYIYALPWVAERIAERILIAWVKQRVSLSSLDILDRFYTAPSKLTAARQQQIAAAFALVVAATRGGASLSPAFQGRRTYRPECFCHALG